jgi:hypothetical protein
MSFEQWFEKVGMLAYKLYMLDPVDLPEEFFRREYDKDSTPRQALSQFEILFL